MILLTLDLATNIGYTWGAVNDPKFVVGSHRLPSTGDDVGEFLWAYDNWLAIWINGGVDYVVFEQPFLPPPHRTSIATLRKLYSLCGHTEFACRAHGIKCAEAPIGSVKRFFNGSGRASKSTMMATAAQWGFQVKNDDEADAIAIRIYTLSREYPELMYKLKLDLGPLGVSAA